MLKNFFFLFLTLSFMNAFGQTRDDLADFKTEDEIRAEGRAHRLSRKECLVSRGSEVVHFRSFLRENFSDKNSYIIDDTATTGSGRALGIDNINGAGFVYPTENCSISRMASIARDLDYAVVTDLRSQYNSRIGQSLDFDTVKKLEWLNRRDLRSLKLRQLNIEAKEGFSLSYLAANTNSGVRELCYELQDSQSSQSSAFESVNTCSRLLDGVVGVESLGRIHRRTPEEVKCFLERMALPAQNREYSNLEVEYGRDRRIVFPISEEKPKSYYINIFNRLDWSFSELPDSAIERLRYGERLTSLDQVSSAVRYCGQAPAVRDIGNCN